MVEAPKATLGALLSYLNFSALGGFWLVPRITTPFFRNSDSVKHHARSRHLSVLSMFVSILLYFSMMGAPSKQIVHSLLKRRLFPHSGRVKLFSQAQGFWDLFFNAAPHLEYFSICRAQH